MIAQATLDDIPHLCGLLAALFEQEADFRPDPARQADALRLIIANPARGRVFVARWGGSVAGMASLLPVSSVSRGGRAFLLEDLIVRTGFRGRGIATSLMRHMIEYAASAGAVKITLLTDAANRRAIGLYQKMGFFPVGGRPFRFHLPAA